MPPYGMPSMAPVAYVSRSAQRLSEGFVRAARGRGRERQPTMQRCIVASCRLAQTDGRQTAKELALAIISDDDNGITRLAIINRTAPVLVQLISLVDY